MEESKVRGGDELALEGREVALLVDVEERAEEDLRS